jgi:hypothetical protein
MEPTPIEKRREPRLPVEVGATVRVRNKDKALRATTVNMSGCGVLLQFAEPTGFSVGDPVMCDFSLSRESDEQLPCWAEGTVVRVERLRVAIDFRGGVWTRTNAAPPLPDDAG